MLRLSELSGGSFTRKQEELQHAGSDAATARQQYEEHQGGTSSLENELQKAETDVKSAYAPVARARADVEQAELRLGNLTQAGKAADFRFGEKMPVLMRALQQHKRSFRRFPVGPIGSYVRLLRPEWSSVLETALGGQLSSFIVTSKSDMNALSNIMQKVNW